MPISDEMRKMILDFASTGSYDVLIAAIEKLEADRDELKKKVGDMRRARNVDADAVLGRLLRSVPDRAKHRANRGVLGWERDEKGNVHWYYRKCINHAGYFYKTVDETLEKL